MYVITLHTGRGWPARGRLERDHLEWDAEHFRDFLGELSVLADFVVGTAQTTTNEAVVGGTFFTS